MRVIIKLGTIFSIVLIILTGCIGNKESESNDSKSEKSKEKVVVIEKELKLYPGDEIINKESFHWGYYSFNGFIGEDTLAFSDSDEMETVVIYQKAEIGLVFKLKEIDTYTFEILDFNREENYLKLKAQRINTDKNSEGKSDEDEKLTITN